MTLLEIVSLICFSIGASLFVCGMTLIFRMGYKYIMYELYGDRDYRNGPYIRKVIGNIVVATMTISLVFFTIGAMAYTVEDHNENKQQEIDHCNTK